MSQVEAPLEGSQPLPLEALVRLSLVVVVSLVLQLSLLDGVRVAGAHPDLLVLLPVAVGLLAGPDRGASVGFVVGLVTDLVLPTPFGLSALVGTLLGAAAGSLRPGRARPSLWMAVPLVAAGAAAGTVLRGVLLALFGVPKALTAYLPPALVVVTVGGLVLGPLVLRAVRWALPVEEPARPGPGLGGSAAPGRVRT
ncbi:rod shape-determining protein MreD [Aciditerrimonas ferrireducens]|jgi:rod shape-determining protein MreD|uniref:Rod shape-determining protein MreD n=1 Tax=Aciditerrimonas ferrireducens TaxID=667306 RepID=A0ABV6C311_9ACTN|nr:rod shape-determining protein MreD [Aciditerrimonas ferrireducens]MCK4177477.1 rod shape-determining protein MreD [Aciditerrimonas ferrireducens]